MNEDEKSMWQPIETAPKDGTKILVCRIGEDEAYTSRSVYIKLNQEQIDQLKIKYTHTLFNSEKFEQISYCFIEPKE